jgi:hypothetical protein
MRRLLIGAWAAAVLLAGAWPASAEDPTPVAAFDTFSILAQSQMATSYLYAVGDEDEHFAAAKASVDKPENVLAIAAAFQRGTAAGYTYGATVGGGSNSGAGGRGIAPEPPLGEADGQYPSTPAEMTWEGPVTGGAKGPVIDGRAHAKATDTPSGTADFTLSHFDVPNTLTVQQAASTSRGEPVAAGLEGESASMLRGITIGSALKIDSMVSRAYGLIPVAPGDTKAVGFTIIQGATVNGVSVQIDDTGIRVSNQAQGTDQKAELDEQLAKGLASANIEDIRLAQAKIVPGDGGKVVIDAGSLVIKYRDKQLASSNPQGFAGGGFALGGALLSLEGHRAEAPAAEEPPTSEAPPTASATTPAEQGSSEPATTATGLVPLDATSTASAGGDRAAVGGFEPQGGVGLSGQDLSYALSPLNELARSDGPAGASGLTVAASPGVSAAPAGNGPNVLVAQPTAASLTRLRDSDWVGAIYLGLVALPMLVLVGFRLAHSR